MPIAILGAGIIGLSTAYYLLELGCTDFIHLIEASELFSGASGYAGGFLASDWYASQVLPLGKLSFKLHRDLAKLHNGRQKWGYASSTGLSLGGEYDDDKDGADWLFQGTSRAQVAERHGQALHTARSEAPDWLRVGKEQNVEVISSGDSTAQVDPLRQCQFLLESCKSRGVVVHQPCSVSKLEVEEHTKRLHSILLSDGTSIPCTKLVLTAGPWTTQVFAELFPKSSQTYKKLKVGSLAGHSIVVRSPHWNNEDIEAAVSENELGCHAVFATSFTASNDLTGDKAFAPEVFSRHPGEIYLAGLNSSSAQLPARVHQSRIDEEAIVTLKAAATKMLHVNGGQQKDIEIIRQGLCFRPTTATGRPYIAQIPSKNLSADCTFEEGDGVWASAGHGPWGISLSQGTGFVLAESIMGKGPSINLAPYRM